MPAGTQVHSARDTNRPDGAAGALESCIGKRISVKRVSGKDGGAYSRISRVCRIDYP